jgi:tetratricopeptide (TPR) repeat protein
MDKFSPKRADLLITVIGCYGPYCSQNERRQYGLEALNILIYGLDHLKEHWGINTIRSEEKEIRDGLAKGDIEGMSRAVCDLEQLCSQLVRPLDAMECLETMPAGFVKPEIEQRDRSRYAEDARQAEIWMKEVKKLQGPKSDHDRAKAYLRLGKDLTALGNYSEAIEDCEKALRIDEVCFPDRSIAFFDDLGSKHGESSPLVRDHLALGNAYMEIGQYKKACEHFEKGLEICNQAMKHAKNIDLTELPKDHKDLEIGFLAARRLASKMDK